MVKGIYGDWTEVEGLLSEMDQNVIEEIKELLRLKAEGESHELGINIDWEKVEWIVRQEYKDHTRACICMTPFPDSIPMVTIAWKTEVE